MQGDNIPDEWNAIHAADTPTTDGLKTVPKRWRTVKAHGTAVGLPSDADMGNSEVCARERAGALACLLFRALLNGPLLPQSASSSPASLGVLFGSWMTHVLLLWSAGGA